MTDSRKSSACVSFLLLLLTATAPSSHEEWARITNGDFSAPELLNSTPYLMYAASLLSNMKGSIDGPWKGLDSAEEEEDEESEGSETQGKTDSEDVISTTSDPAAPTSYSVHDVLEFVLPFLNLKAVTSARSVSRAWKAQSQAVVSFRNDISAVFLPWDLQIPDATPNILRGLPRREAQERLRQALQWQCVQCGYWNAIGKSFCANQMCCQPSGECDATDASPQRLFVGQLRKEDTSKLLWWLLGMILPDVDVVHVESHTNPAQGGRGKGCAWLYVSSTRDVDRVKTLHRRVYVDVDEEGREGVLLSGPSEDDKDLLTRYAGQRVAAEHRPRVLPRNCLVIEEPSKYSGLQRNNASSASSVTRYYAPQHTEYAPQYEAAPATYSYLAPPPPPPPSYYGRSRMHHSGCACASCQPQSYSSSYSYNPYNYNVCPCEQCQGYQSYGYYVAEVPSEYNVIA